MDKAGAYGIQGLGAVLVAGCLLYTSPRKPPTFVGGSPARQGGNLRRHAGVVVPYGSNDTKDQQAGRRGRGPSAPLIENHEFFPKFSLFHWKRGKNYAILR